MWEGSTSTTFAHTWSVVDRMRQSFESANLSWMIGNRNCVGYSDTVYDQRYVQSPTAEPLSEDMERLVRSELATKFYECMAYSLMCTLKFRYGWDPWSVSARHMLVIKRPRLPPEMFVPRSRRLRRQLLGFADTHVAFYVESIDYAFKPGEEFSVKWLGRYVWRAWFHRHGGRPPFLGHQKFAKPIGLNGNTHGEIQKLREFHRSLCDAVSIGLDQQEFPKISTRAPTLRMRLENKKPDPPPPQELRTYKERGRELAHLFRAIVIVVDDQALRYRDPDTCRPVPMPHLPKRVFADREKEQDWIVSQYSVLLCKTGDDAHISSPINFQHLYDSGKAFPVNRPDCRDDEAINVVRVKIDTALEFVFDLIQREREAIPSLGSAADMEDRQHSEACEKWVDGVMAHAGRVGIDKNGFTWEAVRRAKAALNGEAFDSDQTHPLWNYLGGSALPLDSIDSTDDDRI
ncbi:hypothetical protein F4805DRAFT_469919 [Annulohypoxylon moriforme]|nr:hypothetical protein F4805DRAFT_469919 [Annulohypoxylon moriforme]